MLIYYCPYNYIKDNKIAGSNPTYPDYDEYALIIHQAILDYCFSSKTQMIDNSKKIFGNFEKLYNFVVKEEKLDKENIKKFNITNSPNDIWSQFNMGVIYNKINQKGDFFGYELVGFFMIK